MKRLFMRDMTPPEKVRAFRASQSGIKTSRVVLKVEKTKANLATWMLNTQPVRVKSTATKTLR